MKAGVDDYILKDSLVRLPNSIKNIFSRTDAEREKKDIEHLHTKLQVAYHHIEENNKSITDSLNYARLIQQAMLPDKRILDGFFSSSFIIYKPKDIVSGDFYWFHERDQTLTIAIADCTGHGVPGALMSMIGSALLNEIVSVNGCTQPSKVLNRLNSGVRNALKQDENQRNDGMDIAICTVNSAKKEIEFAGANMHLAYFRNGKEMELIKGNKFGIGGLYAHDSGIQFTNHSLTYHEGDVIYLFTDGYADQFGGAQGKRMMTRNLFKILGRSLSFGLEEQENVLIHWLEKWQNNLEQTDDILLLGARF
jgi:serine phosphatase RsbU (regulator of sigma subunit)